MAETYEIVWSGTKEKELHDRQIRPAPPLPEAHGKTGHVQLRTDGGRANEEPAIAKMRSRWLAGKH